MIDTTLSSFDRDVIEASMEVPVLVDFWAPWCGPCKVLGPLLEKLEREYGGRWKLVKVNSDTNPELASSFNLRSIPYSVAFVDGNAVAQFMGAQPEAYVRAFLDRLIPNPGELEHRRHRPAGAAPGRPEVDQHRDRAVLDLLLPARVGDRHRAPREHLLLAAAAHRVVAETRAQDPVHPAAGAARVNDTFFRGRRGFGVHACLLSTHPTWSSKLGLAAFLVGRRLCRC